MDTVNTHQKYIDISNFKNCFGKKHPTFGGYLPNDSQEFCRVFLEDLNSELNEVKEKTLYKMLTISSKKEKIELDKEFNNAFEKREKSIVTDLFYSQIVTTFTCECSAKTYSFQKILDFPLLLPQNQQKVSIKDLLTSYFQTETIDFENKCDDCSKVLKHKKESKISRPPEILILSLQRIDQVTQKKNECMVNFPQILDMSEFIDKECGYGQKPVYNLFGVINHVGKIEYGHYFSYIKIQDREDWFEFNDSAVKNIGKNFDSFPYAYILFYVQNKNMIK